MESHDDFVREYTSVAPHIAWGLAADTNRASRAMGLAAGEFTTETRPDGRTEQVGRGRQLGFGLEWVTGPDSWVEGSWYRTVRRYRKGPVREAVIDYRIASKGKGCIVTVSRSTTGDLPAVLFDRLIAGRNLRRYLDEAAAVAERCTGASRDEPAAVEISRALLQLSPGLLTGGATPGNLAELQHRRRTLLNVPADQPLLDRLAAFLSQQPDEVVAVLSPARFAEWAGSPMRDVLRVFLLAAHAGMLELHWSLRCQVCRVAAATTRTLEELPGEVTCPGCGTHFWPDFSAHIEAAFSIHPGIRRVFGHTYCAAGAVSRPQVFAQLVATRESPCDLRTVLLDGELVLRVLGRPEVVTVGPRPARLRVTVKADKVEVEVGPRAEGETEVSVRTEVGAGPAVVMLERGGWAEDWVSAAQLATFPEFHELFGGEAPLTRHEVTVGTLTMLFSDLRGSTALYQRVGDARAFALVADHFDRLTRCIEANEGALIKTMGDAVMAVFQTPAAAVRAALAMQQAIAGSETGAAGLVLKLGLHTGNCLAVRANGKLDFFGHNVNLAARAQAQSQGNDIVVTEPVLAQADVAALLEGVPRESFEATLKGIDRPQRLWRLRPAAKGTGQVPPVQADGMRR